MSSGSTRRISGTFQARSDDGREHTVLIITDYLHHQGPYDDPDAVVEGARRLRTTEGAEVQRIRRGEYQVVDTGEVLRSDAPDAF